MRIITGSRRGKFIAAPDHLPVRPTTDRAKEALFSRLASYFNWPSMQALDLFAGTGNISYELCSRGAAHVDAVDNHAGCIKFIARTAVELDFTTLSAHRMDALAFVNGTSSKYQFIFADPPYDWDGHEALIESVMHSGILEDDGWFVLEHRADRSFTSTPWFYDERKYGSVKFSTFVIQEDA
jgi:16S rRNA (guanine966-N2)-methyltransferase